MGPEWPGIALECVFRETQIQKTCPKLKNSMIAQKISLHQLYSTTTLDNISSIGMLAGHKMHWSTMIQVVPRGPAAWNLCARHCFWMEIPPPLRNGSWSCVKIILFKGVAGKPLLPKRPIGGWQSKIHWASNKLYMYEDLIWPVVDTLKLGSWNNVGQTPDGTNLALPQVFPFGHVETQPCWRKSRSLPGNHHEDRLMR